LRFVLLVEGPSEKLALPQFFKRWLDERFLVPIDIKAIVRTGAANVCEEAPKDVPKLLNALNAPELVGIISICDLASELPFLNPSKSKTERIEIATKFMLDKVDHDKYRHFFIVHELEAWLLSNPTIFGKELGSEVSKKIKKNPEEINDKKPPAKLLDEVFFAKTGRNYEDRKPETCANAFRKLDVEKAYAACPSLAAILDEMLSMALAAGLEPKPNS
jgi:hypothetical protein